MDKIKRIVVVHSPSSTRSKQYQKNYQYLSSRAKDSDWKIVEIELVNVPYFEAVQKVSSQLLDDDLVVAAGGDGITQVTFQATFSSQKDVIFATIPLGNSNDISRAFNRKNHTAEMIINEDVIDFYPLYVVTDNGYKLAISSYISFGATTVLVNYLNSQKGRKIRKYLRALTPAMSLPIGSIGKISREINQLEFPDYRLSNNDVYTEDSVGFFLIPAAHNLLRPSKDIRLAKSEFFLHQAKTKDKRLVGKIIMAGLWSLRFPGSMTELEEIRFINNDKDIIANISGDNVNLGKVKKISAIRSVSPVKILCNTKQ